MKFLAVALIAFGLGSWATTLRSKYAPHEAIGDPETIHLTIALRGGSKTVNVLVTRVENPDEIWDVSKVPFGTSTKDESKPVASIALYYRNKFYTKYIGVIQGEN